MVMMGESANLLHALTLKGLALGSPLLPYPTSQSDWNVEAFGLDFPNPIGLAAGADKDAEAVVGWCKLGFGFVEVGTVLPRPHAGNPTPNLHRLAAHRSVVNSLGFPSKGAQAVYNNLASHRVAAAKKRTGMVIGVNVSKHPLSDKAQAGDDVLESMKILWDVADYFTVNLSSPNSPGLRQLQRAEDISNLLAQIGEGMHKQATMKPLLVKLSPDMNPADLSACIESIDKSRVVAGLVLTNTTLERPADLSEDQQQLKGGLSGAKLTARSVEVQRQVHELTALPVVASGGLMTVADIRERFSSGAVLAQLYTGLVYNPLLVNKCRSEFPLT